MDRVGLNAAVEAIRSALRRELELQRGSPAEANYASAVQICDEMLAKIADDGLAFTEQSLFGDFDRYLIDSLPWTAKVLKRIGEARATAKSCLK